ncbi:hypothetical protein [Methylobacterium nonmethylotrophicum]|uniref:Chromosome partition protein Smc n=1 Tax=Methylobacterium nonmethylotrophicum TaxID=1141884 RepID=A0A4Z0NNJ9_9HYPH|nr:hypothetical protein [Methylobacterium nonmethylotrophicum]TGD98266.1 hypothetical protein EU555_16285 [Methylobacterium nonmethylotrophicum]
MKFWLGLAACLALAAIGLALNLEGSPQDGAAAATWHHPSLPDTADLTEADRAGVPRQMQARVILARQAGDTARQAGDTARQADGTARQADDPVRPTARPAEPAPDAVAEVRRQAEVRVRQAEAEAAASRQRLEQEEARANSLSDAAMAARRDLIAARAEAEELRARTMQDRDAGPARTAVAAEEARRDAEGAAEGRRQALAGERARADELAEALAESRRRVAALETAAEAARLAHAAQEEMAARERAMMRAGLRRLAVALRAAEVARSEAVAREAQAAGARDRAEQGRQAAERAQAETRGRLERLRDRVERVSEARPPEPTRALQARLSAAPRGGGLPFRAVPPAAAPSPPRPAPIEPIDEARLLARVAALLGRGDISGARLFLTLGVRAGSARATALLAETYDPDRLAALQVRGMRGDPETASALYRQARAGRDQENRKQEDRGPGEPARQGGPRRTPGWTDPVRQAGLPGALVQGPFVAPLAAPWAGE